MSARTKACPIAEAISSVPTRIGLGSSHRIKCPRSKFSVYTVVMPDWHPERVVQEMGQPEGRSTQPESDLFRDKSRQSSS